MPSIPEEELDSVVDKVKKAFTDEGGIEVDGETPFKHPLSYTMSKTVGASHYVVNEAYIGWVKFDIEVSKILDVKIKLEKIFELLRFLIVKAPRKTEFTFAKARIALAEKEKPKDSETEEAIPAEEPAIL